MTRGIPCRLPLLFAVGAMAGLFAAAPAAAQPRSVYTDIAQGKCKVVKKAEEGDGEWAITRCGRMGAWTLFVDYDDAREFVRLTRPGVELKLPHGVATFNSVGPKLEWRLRGAASREPYAAIFRVRWKDLQTQQNRSRLVVAKLGPAGGCVVAYVDHHVGAMNRRARHIADTRVADFACGTDKVIHIR